MILKGHTINPGYAEGEAIVTNTPFSFVGEIEPVTGVFSFPRHELFGQRLAGKILIFPTGKGSAGAPATAWRTMKAGNSPKAIICIESEPILSAAVIIADIPAVDRLNQNPLDMVKTGDYVKVNATDGTVELIKEP